MKSSENRSEANKTRFISQFLISTHNKLLPWILIIACLALLFVCMIVGLVIIGICLKMEVGYELVLNILLIILVLIPFGLSIVIDIAIIIFSIIRFQWVNAFNALIASVVLCSLAYGLYYIGAHF